MEKNAVLVTNRQLPKNILSKLNDLRRENGSWCDLRLQVASREPDGAPVVFPVHSCIVAAASETFALMVEKKVKHAILSDIDSYHFSLCLNFIYGSEIFVSMNDIPGLISCAEKLSLPGLVKICKNISQLSSAGEQPKDVAADNSETDTEIVLPPNQPVTRQVVMNKKQVAKASRLHTKKILEKARQRTKRKAALLSRKRKAKSRADAYDTDTSEADYNSDVSYEGPVETPQSPTPTASRQTRSTNYSIKTEPETPPQQEIVGNQNKSPSTLLAPKCDLPKLSTVDEIQEQTKDFKQPIQKKVSSGGKKKKRKALLQDWLKARNIELGDIDFNEFADELEVPEHIRPMMAVEYWPNYIRIGRFRGTPRMAYSAYYNNNYKEFPCEVCGEVVLGRIKLRQHIQNVHEERSFCQFCAKPFANIHNLRMHEKRHKIEEKKIKCDHCDFTCFFRGELTQHEERKHRDVLDKKTYLCSICACTFESESYLRVHEQRVHNKEEWQKKSPKNKCDLCDYVGFRKRDLDRHKLNRHSKLKPFVCEICRRVAFKQKSQLNNHIRKEHGQEPARGKVKTVMNMHEKEETKIVELLPPIPKPVITYQCPSCEYTSTSNRNLKTHMIVHSDDRPFQCSYCPEAFKRKDVLVRHTMRHHKIDMRTTPHKNGASVKQDPIRGVYQEVEVAYVPQETEEIETQMYITQVDAPDAEYFPFEAPVVHGQIQ